MNIGDVITTEDDLDALPVGTVLHAPSLDVPARCDVWVRWPHGWKTDGLHQSEDRPTGWLPMTVVALPGRLPRPERVVKAEALREWARQVRDTYPEDVFGNPAGDHLAAVHRFCQERGSTLDAISAKVMRLAAERAEWDASRIEACDAS